MNTVVGEPDAAVFKDSGVELRSSSTRRNDGSSAATRWDRAFARFEKAQAALDAAAHTPDEDLNDRLGTRHDRAMRRLIRTPAPDLPALAAKLDLALDQRSGEFFGESADMKAIKSDAHRLASPAKSDCHCLPKVTVTAHLSLDAQKSDCHSAPKRVTVTRRPKSDCHSTPQK